MLGLVTVRSLFTLFTPAKGANSISRSRPFFVVHVTFRETLVTLWELPIAVDAPASFITESRLQPFGRELCRMHQKAVKSLVAAGLTAMMLQYESLPCITLDVKHNYL